MFSRVFFVSSLAMLAAAMPTDGGNGGSSGGNCNTGEIKCCNKVTKASDPAAATVLSGLGIVVQDVNALVGLTCSDVTVVGGGSSSCNAQPVCCQDNSHGTLISIGCIPISL